MVRKPIFACCCACAAALLASCEAAKQLAAPDPMPTRSAAHTLGGIVTSGGMPMGGATVVVRNQYGYFPDGNYPFPLEELSTQTDGSGSYSFAEVPESFFRFGMVVRASKDGYFTDFRGPITGRDARLDFDLDPWILLALDQVIRGRVSESHCAGLSGWVGGPCQRFALTVARPATLELTAPVFPFELGVVTPHGLFVGGYSPSAGAEPLNLQIPVERGTYEIDVVAIGPVRDFVLTTALR